MGYELTLLLRGGTFNAVACRRMLAVEIIILLKPEDLSIFSDGYYELDSGTFMQPFPVQGFQRSRSGRG
jgi:hypothetical protein